ncbi:MAG TPA: glycosyl hydrolase [Coriobacteriia bacterium]|nr:glycosyl hydrolase [Coriobacteriia bacterium]
MRKIAVLLTIAMLASVVVPSTAVAKTRTHRHVKVKASARVAKKSGKAKSVVISSKASRAGRAVVTIYKGKKVVRKIHTQGRARRRTTRWNLKDKSGKKVDAGTYTYKVQVVSGAAVGTVQGLVSISKPGRVKPTRPTAPVPVNPVVTNPAPAPATPAPATGRWIGMWMPYIASDPAKLAEAQTMIGGKLHVIQIFQADSEGGFPTSRVTNIVNNGSIPLITLGLNCTEGTGPSAITNGVADAYLHAYAKSAKAFGSEIWFRPFHEMNGNWYPWSGTGNGTPAQVVAAWKHVHDIFVAEGATNVKFVWCPNGESVPNTSANSIEKYWPGDAYVDMAAIDCYNAGTSASWSHWQTIDESMGPAYKVVTGLTQKPLFIAESSCSEKGGDKAAWIADTFAKFTTKYTRITGVVWFNEKLAEDWRVNSTEASLNAFRKVVATGY